MENLHKVGGSLKRLRQAETLLWQELMQRLCLLIALHHCKLDLYQLYHRHTRTSRTTVFVRLAVESAVSQTPPHQNLRRSVEECSSSVGSPLCLSEWIADGLAYPKGDMPHFRLKKQAPAKLMETIFFEPTLALLLNMQKLVFR